MFIIKFYFFENEFLHLVWYKFILLLSFVEREEIEQELKNMKKDAAFNTTNSKAEYYAKENQNVLFYLKKHFSKFVFIW